MGASVGATAPNISSGCCCAGTDPAFPFVGNCSRLQFWTGSTCSEPSSVPWAAHPNQGHQIAAVQRGHRGWHFEQIRNAFFSCSVPQQQLSASPCSFGELLLHPASQGKAGVTPKAPKLHLGGARALHGKELCSFCFQITKWNWKQQCQAREGGHSPPWQPQLSPA